MALFSCSASSGGRNSVNAWQAEWHINQGKNDRKKTVIFRKWPNIGAQFSPFVAFMVILVSRNVWFKMVEPRRSNRQISCTLWKLSRCVYYQSNHICLVYHNTSSFNQLNCLYLCTTCFGLYFGHLQECQQKNIYRKIQSEVCFVYMRKANKMHTFLNNLFHLIYPR
jgi:hypothetical protein